MIPIDKNISITIPNSGNDFQKQLVCAVRSRPTQEDESEFLPIPTSGSSQPNTVQTNTNNYKIDLVINGHEIYKGELIEELIQNQYTDYPTLFSSAQDIEENDNPIYFITKSFELPDSHLTFVLNHKHQNVMRYRKGTVSFDLNKNQIEAFSYGCEMVNKYHNGFYRSMIDGFNHKRPRTSKQNIVIHVSDNNNVFQTTEPLFTFKIYCKAMHTLDPRGKWERSYCPNNFELVSMYDPMTGKTVRLNHKFHSNVAEYSIRIPLENCKTYFDNLEIIQKHNNSFVGCPIPMVGKNLINTNTSAATNNGTGKRTR